jgi:diaminopimelate epimerase
MFHPITLHVVKGHAYGNDFLLVPESDANGREPAALARAMCHRHAGIGADGLILYRVLSDRMHILRLHNADGSAAEISGNGVRCLAAYALARDLLRDAPSDAHEVKIETAAGLKTLRLVERSGGRWTFRAMMGKPSAIRELELEAAGQAIKVVALSVGNPQCIVLEPLDERRFLSLGPALERHPAFADRTNVEFVEVQASNRIRILIWERGVGPTTALGTGACGAAVAAMTFAGVDRDVEVESPGGVQRVEWREEGLYLTGWAELVFEGRWMAESA